MNRTPDRHTACLKMFWQLEVVPHTGCLSASRIRPHSALTLDVLEGPWSGWINPIRVQTSRPEPDGHLRSAHVYVSGVGGGPLS
jgi:hypothetical protein